VGGSEVGDIVVVGVSVEGGIVSVTTEVGGIDRVAVNVGSV
jgi:hypothetical protein